MDGGYDLAKENCLGIKLKKFIYFEFNNTFSKLFLSMFNLSLWSYIVHIVSLL